MKRLMVFLVIFWTLFHSSVYAGDGVDLSIEEISRKKLHHGRDGRFLNPWCMNCRKSFFDLLKWKFFSRNIYSEEKKEGVAFNLIKPDFTTLNKTHGDYMVWLGHSTVLMRVGGKIIITDPVFWDINRFLKRKTPFPFEPEELPEVDYVLISHAHYDHLDYKSIMFLKERFDPFFISGPGYEYWFSSIGTSKHIVLDWWDDYEIEDIKITSLPVHHWSKRRIFDTDKTLWCSFLIERGGIKYYWIADSGYFEGYKEIGGKFGPIDILFVPIGAYEPRWFMETYHVNPEEAIKVAKDVRAKTFIPIHWGTFDLSDEPLWLPIEHLKEIYKEGSSPVLKILDHGGHLITEGR